MGGIVKEIPRIEQELIDCLDERFKLTEAHLKEPEWDRAFLAGQRSVIQFLSSVRIAQEEKNKQSITKRL